MKTPETGKGGAKNGKAQATGRAGAENKNDTAPTKSETPAGADAGNELEAHAAEMANRAKELDAREAAVADREEAAEGIEADLKIRAETIQEREEACKAQERSLEQEAGRITKELADAGVMSILPEVPGVESIDVEGKVTITARRDGFRRGGMRHPKSKTEYPASRFTVDQLRQIIAEPNLAVSLEGDKLKKLVAAD